MSTLLASTRERQMLATTPAELTQAQHVVDQLETQPKPKLSIHPTDTENVEMPPELSAVIAKILGIVAAGGTVTIGSMPEVLTTSTAAEQLGISRPTLMKMIARNEIRAHRVGSHTRLLTADVMEFRESRQDRRRQAFQNLRALEDEAD